MDRAVVLLSGGMDSSTCLALAVRELTHANVLALSLYYGQKHAVEIEQAKQIAAHYGVAHEEHQLPPVFAGGGSTLTDANRPNPELSYAEIMSSEGPSPTYVPFRNANLLSAATALAMVRYLGDAPLMEVGVYFGAHAEDAHNWAYPDCTPEFIGAMANAIYIGTYRGVRLVTPLEWMTKADVVRLGSTLGVPFELTHSCYNGARPACGRCPTCVERLEAFRQAGIADPLPYEPALAPR